MNGAGEGTSLRTQLLLAGGLLAALGAGAYLFYTQWYQSRAPPPRTDADGSTPGSPAGSEQSARRRRRRTTRAAEDGTPSYSDAAQASPTGSNGMLHADAAEVLRRIDLPLKEMQALPAKAKEQLFYGLLMQGEKLMVKDADGIRRAVEYFAKAAAIVPNPAEVVGAFEKTLPPPVFALFLERVQHDISARVTDYFATVLPEPSRRYVRLRRSEKHNAHVPVADARIPPATTLWTEDADVTVAAAGLAQGAFCAHCLRDLNGLHGTVRCEACAADAVDELEPTDRAVYCCAECRAAAEGVHAYVCPGAGAAQRAQEAHAQLLAHCRKTQQTLPLLLLRYLAEMIRLEADAKTASEDGASGVSSAFLHYDHLRPQFGPRTGPTEREVAEAHLLRAVLGAMQPNVIDFLTDAIYTAMKATLSAAVTGIRARPAVPALEADGPAAMQTRQVGTTASAYALFHLSAHLLHSCEPNVGLIEVDESGTPGDARPSKAGPASVRVRATALRAIEEGEPLTMTYLPFDALEGVSVDDRQRHLLRLAGFVCSCPRCASAKAPADASNARDARDARDAKN